MVRGKDKQASVQSQYPKVRVVFGSNEDYDLIRAEAREADIVFDFANSADDIGAATAISDGLSQHSPDRPGYWIHTSGTGILTYVDVERDVYGQIHDKVHDDWDNVSELVSLPDIAWHREVDKIVLALGTGPVAKEGKVKTAIVCPPHIYGVGRGPLNKRSINIPNMAKMALERGKGFKVAQGENIWHAVHVYDLSELYLMFAESVVSGDGKLTWGAEGYYLAEQEEFVWGELAEKIAKIVHEKGWIKTADIDAVPVEEIRREFPARYRSWGANSRGKAIRAEKLLRWKCDAKGLDDGLEELVEWEAKALGKM